MLLMVLGRRLLGEPATLRRRLLLLMFQLVLFLVLFLVLIILLLLLVVVVMVQIRIRIARVPIHPLELQSRMENCSSSLPNSIRYFSLL